MRSKLLALDLLNIEHKDIKLSFCRYLRVFLSERTCGSVSWVFERLLVIVLLLFNKLQKNISWHICFAPDFYQRQFFVYFYRYGLYSFQIRSNVLSHKTVTTGRAYCKLAVVIFKGYRKSVYFRLNNELRFIHSLLNCLNKASHLFKGKNVLQRPHLHTVSDFLKYRYSLAAYTLSRGVASDKLWKLLLKTL